MEKGSPQKQPERLNKPRWNREVLIFSQVLESMVESRRTVEHEESGEEISFLNNDINHNSLIIYYINHAFFKTYLRNIHKYLYSGLQTSMLDLHFIASRQTFPGGISKVVLFLVVLVSC